MFKICPLQYSEVHINIFLAQAQESAHIILQASPFISTITNLMVPIQLNTCTMSASWCSSYQFSIRGWNTGTPGI